MFIFPLPSKRGNFLRQERTFGSFFPLRLHFIEPIETFPLKPLQLSKLSNPLLLPPLCHWFSIQYSCRRRIHASFRAMCATGVDSARIRHRTRRIPLDSGYLPPSNRWETSPPILAKRWGTFLFRWGTFCSCSPSSPLIPLFSIVIARSERYLYPCVAQV